MLESILGELSSGLRSKASQIASLHGCAIASTLEVYLDNFPVISFDNQGGLVRSLKLATALTKLDVLGYGRVVEFVEETDPSRLIGVTASGRPKLLITPALVKVPTEGNGYGSGVYVSAVGVFTLRRKRGITFNAGHSTNPSYRDK